MSHHTDSFLLKLYELNHRDSHLTALHAIYEAGVNASGVDNANSELSPEQQPRTVLGEQGPPQLSISSESANSGQAAGLGVREGSVRGGDKVSPTDRK